MSDRVSHSGFNSKIYGREKRKYTYRYFGRTYPRKSNLYKKENGSSMLAKMGICALLAGIVLLSDFMGSRQELLEVSSNIIKNGEDVGGDYLGKLRFVELPGIIQVFSSDAKLNIGTEYQSIKLNEEKTSITISGITSEFFPAPQNGIIKTIRTESGKAYLELSVDGDIVLCFSGEGEIAAEEGQPVKQGDTLLKNINTIEIGMTKSGRPVNPAEYFNINSVNLA